MRSIRLTPRFWFAGGGFLLVVLFAVIGPLLTGSSPNEEIGGMYEPPSGSALLGTDNLGNDVLTNLMHGTRTSLVIGLTAGVVATVLGTLIGLVAGYRPGFVEEALMAVTNITLAIPAIVVLILLSVALPTRSLFALAIVIGLTSWTWTARSVRAQTASVRAREHLDVAKLSGASTWSILRLDILPFLLSYIWMVFVLQVSAAILAEAALSMLGLGPSDTVSLGNMLHWSLANEALRTGAWWAFVPPTIFLTLIAFTLLLLQSSLDEVFNPRLRGRGLTQATVGDPATGGAPAGPVTGSSAETADAGAAESDHAVAEAGRSSE